MIKYIFAFLLIASTCCGATLDSTFTYGGPNTTTSAECHDTYTSGVTADSAKNYGATTSKETTANWRYLASWGRPRKSWWTSVEYCSCGVNAAGAAFASTNISVYEMLRPVYDFTGNNNGTNADAGESHNRAWRESGGNTDTTWRSNGIDGASDDGTWNRGKGTNGYDRKSTSMGTIVVPQSASQGFFYTTCDTAWVRRVLLGENDELALLFKPAAGGATIYSADTYGGDVYPYTPIVWFKLRLTTNDRGTGRFGRDNSGVYRDDR